MTASERYDSQQHQDRLAYLMIIKKGELTMMTVLENIRRLEQYFINSGTAINPVPETGISKLIHREFNGMAELKNRLSGQIEEFERRYSLASKDFYIRYENGVL